MKTIRSFLLWWLATSVLLVSAVRAQGNAAPAGASSAPPPFTTQELDSLLAPIALYPDGLHSQVLMASTYPLEVVQAARWSKANPGLSGDDAVKRAGKESWDVSVMSLVAFPNVLEMMNKELEWTQKLGDAFLGQQKEVLAAVQRLRQLAKNNGNLESNQQQVVRTEAQSIIIEPARPETIYVPAYNPTVVYGAWPYPAYPPYYYPGVAAWYPGSALLTGLAWGVGFAAADAVECAASATVGMAWPAATIATARSAAIPADATTVAAAVATTDTIASPGTAAVASDTIASTDAATVATDTISATDATTVATQSVAPATFASAEVIAGLVGLRLPVAIALARRLVAVSSVAAVLRIVLPVAAGTDAAAVETVVWTAG